MLRYGQWLGIGTVLLMGMAILGSLILVSQSIVLSAPLFFWLGWCCGGLVRDPAGRMPVTDKAILTFALMLTVAACCLAGLPTKARP